MQRERPGGRVGGWAFNMGRKAQPRGASRTGRTQATPGSAVSCDNSKSDASARDAPQLYTAGRWWVCWPPACVCSGLFISLLLMQLPQLQQYVLLPRILPQFLKTRTSILATGNYIRVRVICCFT